MPAVKLKKIAAAGVLLSPPPRQVPGLAKMYLRPVLYPSDGEHLNEGMHVWASLTTRRHSEREEGILQGVAWRRSFWPAVVTDSVC